MNASARSAREIFLEAVRTVPPDCWHTYLFEVCRGDDELRSHVKELLEAHAAVGSFLESPASHGAGVAATFDEPRITEGPDTVIGPYKLLEQIGEGGFGVVFMAEQTQPVRRKVALKLLKPGMDTRQVVARFEAERQALAIMDHPNIAKVLDGGATASGRPFFVMDLVKGVPITEHCDQNHLTPRERLELFVSVCHAVQHAHQKGIIHRDLKPSNVLVTMHDTTPVVKVIDFGVAKAMGQTLTDKTLFTGFAQMIGSPLYMSPEQAGQSSLDVDTRSDIYSLGVLLYELLTGTTPFEKERLRDATYEEIRRIVRDEEPPRPSTRLSDLGKSSAHTPRAGSGTRSMPSSVRTSLASIAALRHMEPATLPKLLRGELDWIVMKALEKDRSRRYETANGLAMDVERYLSDEPVQACPPSAAYRLRKFARRHKGPVWAAALVALALAGGIVGTTWGMLRATKAETLAVAEAKQKEQERDKAVNERERATAAEREARRRLYEAKLATAKARRWSGLVGHRFNTLQTLSEAAEIARELGLDESHRLTLRNEAIACMCLTDLRPLRDWKAPVEWPLSTFDAELRRCAETDRQGNVTVRRVEDDQVLVQLPKVSSPGQIAWLALSPDGRFLPIRHESWPETQISIWDLERREVALRVPGASSCDFSADSRRTAICRYDGSVGIYDLSTGEEEQYLPPGREASRVDTFCSFNAQGSKLAVFFMNDREVRIWDPRSDGPAKTLACPDLIYALAWHPGGKLLAVGTEQMQIHLWDLEADRPYKVLEGHDLTVSGLTFNRAGDLLASSSYDGTICLWDPRVGRPLVRISGSSAQFSTDDRRLAIRNPAGWTVFDLNPGQPYRLLHHGTGIGTSVFPAVSPDGRLLVTASADGVRIMNLAAGAEAAWLDIGPTYTVHFDAAGENMFTWGRAGLHRWRFAPGEKPPDHGLRIGPPQAFYAGAAHTVPSRDGNTLLVWDRWQHAVVLDAESQTVKARLSTPVRMFALAVSPDGRWAAIGTPEQGTVHIWDIQTDQLVHQFPNPGVGSSRAAFSPDGRWLVVSGVDEHICLEVGAWQERWRHRTGFGTSAIAPPLAFAPDGRVLALASTPRDVALVDPATGREYCTLVAPTPQFIHQLCFSPDGTQLVATNDRSQAIPTWDLRQIREELAAMGLDWELPPYLPCATGDATPIRIDVDLGEIPQLNTAEQHFARARAHLNANRRSEAIAEYSKGLELAPNDALALNNLAWCLVSVSGSPPDDVARAVPLARRAVELAPENAANWNTLGVAHYYAGDFTSAIDALLKSEQLEPGRYFSFNGFFLAKAHWQLGNRPVTDQESGIRGQEMTTEERARHQSEARKWFDQAVEWMEKNQPQDRELKRFRAEASELLGVNSSQ